MHKVRIIYKSGATIDIRCSSFKITTNALGAKSYSWGSDTEPRPLELGADEIAAVWELK